jgi:hypothetical protein
MAFLRAVSGRRATALGMSPASSSRNRASAAALPPLIWGRCFRNSTPSCAPKASLKRLNHGSASRAAAESRPVGHTLMTASAVKSSVRPEAASTILSAAALASGDALGSLRTESASRSVRGSERGAAGAAAAPTVNRRTALLPAHGTNSVNLTS